MEAAPMLEKLSLEGWNLTTAGLNLVTENGNITEIKQIARKLLDVDLRSVSSGSIPEDITRTKYDSIPGGIVLQIQKVKNLSTPKYKEVLNNNPQNILKFVLTDGVQNIQGVAMEVIPSLDVNTYPGSKILLTGEVEIAHCFLLLTQENTSFIGGRVDHMIEKWELNRSLAKHKRVNQEEGGPPPWIPFGQKIAKQVVADKNFKSLEQGKSKDVTENSEFEAQRKGAIMEAYKIGAPKVFGGGNNKLLDHNVQVIVDAGFSVEQAEYALKICKNNTDRALRSLQSKTTKANSGDGGGKGGKAEEKGSGKPAKGRGRHRDDEATSSLKPSGKVSLFDFLEDKLPTSEKDLMLQQTETRGMSDKRYNKPSKPYEERKNGFDRLEMKSQGRRPDGPRIIPNERRSNHDHKSDTVKFESKKTYDSSRKDKSFGNFKVDHENAFPPKNVRLSEKRDGGPRSAQSSSRNYYNKNDKGFDSQTHEEPNTSARKSTFAPNNEKPPRFLKYQQNQQNEGPVPHWNDPATYSRIPQQSDFQLQNSLANLSLQPNVANFPNQNSHDYSAPPNRNKNMFYQNMVIPTTQNTETHRPPPAQPVAVTSYPNRSPAGFLPTDVSMTCRVAKTPPYPGLPTVPDYPFKAVPGFNDFQNVFGSATNTPYSANSFDNTRSNFNNSQNSYSNSQNAFNSSSTFSSTPSTYNGAQTTYNNAQNSYNNPQNPPNLNLNIKQLNINSYSTPSGALNSYPSTGPPFISSQQMMQATPHQVQSQSQGRRWSWKKGQKCFARYWEDQQFYNAIVTGVSDNTCVVRFTEYGNYEEVLQDDCIPQHDMQPES